jgi:hypothetical protein
MRRVRHRSTQRKDLARISASENPRVIASAGEMTFSSLVDHGKVNPSTGLAESQNHLYDYTNSREVLYGKTSRPG